MPVDVKAKSEELVKYLTGAGFIKTAAIGEAFRKVPRHNFVKQVYFDMAYEDIALPIAKESTISQPSTVATMLELLQPQPGDNILEIGTGSGWQASLMAMCVMPRGHVVTVEIDNEVAEFAKKNIERSGILNIRLLSGDGSLGYIEEAPYDKIIYAAALPDVPKQILAQLKVEGRVVAPVGTRLLQTLKVIEKIDEKRSKEYTAGTFQFVSMRGQLGF